jgi:hypothetical protein
LVEVKKRKRTKRGKTNMSTFGPVIHGPKGPHGRNEGDERSLEDKILDKIDPDDEE